MRNTRSDMHERKDMLAAMCNEVRALFDNSINDRDFISKYLKQC
jgi:hypothetical protein